MHTYLKLAILSVLVSLPSLTIPVTGVWVCPLTLIVFSLCLPLIVKKMPQKTSTVITVLIILCVIAFQVLVKVYLPDIDAKVDRDEALEISAHRLLSGLYPYSEKTQLGSPITPMLGATILSIPFVLIGIVSLQNYFWLFIFLFFIGKKSSLAPVLFVTGIILSPMLLQEFVYEGDLLTNSIYVSFAFYFFDKRPNFITAVFLGLSLASRMNFLFLLPILFLWHRNDKQHLSYFFVSVLVLSILTIPFFLYAPSLYSPLHVFNKIDNANANGILIIVLSLVVIALSKLANLSPLLAAMFSQLLPVITNVLSYVYYGMERVTIEDRLAYVIFCIPFAFIYFCTGNPNDPD